MYLLECVDGSAEALDERACVLVEAGEDADGVDAVDGGGVGESSRERLGIVCSVAVRNILAKGFIFSSVHIHLPTIQKTLIPLFLISCWTPMCQYGRVKCYRKH